MYVVSLRRFVRLLRWFGSSGIASVRSEKSDDSLNLDCSKSIIEQLEGELRYMTASRRPIFSSTHGTGEFGSNQETGGIALMGPGVDMCVGLSAVLGMIFWIEHGAESKMEQQKGEFQYRIGYRGYWLLSPM
ncbi:hypothetical protein QAD02_021921 [Eretmocerus hayati]|uniref:Uncharacterized protein n=1 Tax=Eretmocerus hayati TaxID=131215 RepID=A0ACC2PUS9_9HYME|nr:hypothetical protein QAD02_021921 [Eretmocerus hayati]